VAWEHGGLTEHPLPILPTNVGKTWRQQPKPDSKRFEIKVTHQVIRLFFARLLNSKTREISVGEFQVFLNVRRRNSRCLIKL